MTEAYSKNEPSVKGLLQEFDDFLALFIIREVGNARETDWVVRPARMRMFRTLNSTLKIVMNFNRSTVLESGLK